MDHDADPRAALLRRIDGVPHVVLGPLLLAVLTPWELAMRSSRDFSALAASAIALGLPFLLVWFTGAVGIIGSENNSANLMFFVVIAIALEDRKGDEIRARLAALRAARAGCGLIVCLPDAEVLAGVAPFDAVLRIERNTVLAA